MGRSRQDPTTKKIIKVKMKMKMKITKAIKMTILKRRSRLMMRRRAAPTTVAAANPAASNAKNFLHVGFVMIINGTTTKWTQRKIIKWTGTP